MKNCKCLSFKVSGKEGAEREGRGGQGRGGEGRGSGNEGREQTQALGGGRICLQWQAVVQSDIRNHLRIIVDVVRIS